MFIQRHRRNHHRALYGKPTCRSLSLLRVHSVQRQNFPITLENTLHYHLITQTTRTRVEGHTKYHHNNEWASVHGMLKCFSFFVWTYVVTNPLFQIGFQHDKEGTQLSLRNHPIEFPQNRQQLRPATSRRCCGFSCT